MTTPLLYPFNSAYGVYAGYCTGANPQTMAPPVTVPFAKTPNGLDPGELLFPVRIRQPALNVRVIDGANAVYNQHITATPVRGNCAGQVRHRLWSYMGTNAADTGNVNRGWASKNASVAAGGYDPGLPFGEYDICVDNGSRRSRSTVAALQSIDVTTAAGSTPVTFDLGISATRENGTCAW